MRRRLWIAGSLVAAVACSTPVEPSADAASTDAARADAGIDAAGTADAGPCLVHDADGDHVDSIACGGTDCDDTNAARHPGAVEVCDTMNLDEDCDPTTYGHRDLDGDGHDDAACCNGTVCGDDCDDSRASVYAGLVEACDGLDNDCDTVTDEGVIFTYFADCDGDGYGTNAGNMMGCAPPPTAPPCTTIGHTWVTAGGDCQDDLPLIHPGLADVCNGVDDDCSGTVDDAASADASCNFNATGSSCVSGACTTPTCTGTFLDCYASVPGCESDPASSPYACGGCGTVCGHATCTAGVCNDDFVEISAGDATTCGRRRSGAVACWGWNTFGQLGDGTTTPHHTPLPVVGITDAVEISAGHALACARHATGTVSCWGGVVFGGIGDGVTMQSSVPVDVTGLSDAVEIGVGDRTMCARRATGEVVCWGNAFNGALGDGTGMNALAPVTVVGITTATELSVGGGFACVVLADASVSCWGWNGQGQLADGSTSFRTTPVASAAGVMTTAVSAGYDHACALGVGAAACWGQGDHGQLGDAMMANSSVPVLVHMITGGSSPQLSAGRSHTCIVRGVGRTLECWGMNDHGQLGDSTTTDRNVATPIFGYGSIAQVSAGYTHTCALQTSGVVSCWGNNTDGELGDGTTTSRSVPGPIVDL